MQRMANAYLRNVPEKSVGSWGIIDILDRSTLNSTDEVLTSSSRMSPSTRANLKMDEINDDFPAPVRPTTLIFSLGWTENDSSRSTGSSSAE